MCFSGGVDAVGAAFEAVPRAGFLTPAQADRASYDGPIEIGRGQTNSQPSTVEAMLRLLAVEPGQRVLDVGSGSGWTTALLAQLTGPEGRVIGVELEPELVEFGAANLARSGAVGAEIRQAERGVLGLPTEGPFDRILVSAEPVTLPQELVDQVADGGRMVIPVGGTMLLVVRHGDDVEVTRHGGYRFVPLRPG
jgi:protein-L-isoaspartate(D-aspartate) O-methyltransferase